MTNQKAKTLWEDALLNGTSIETLKKLGISKKEAKTFMSYTMPEMFVDNEINRLNLLKIKELGKKSKQILAVLKGRKNVTLMLNIGLGFYFAVVVPTLVSIIYIKYIF